MLRRAPARLAGRAARHAGGLSEGFRRRRLKRGGRISPPLERVRAVRRRRRSVHHAGRYGLVVGSASPGPRALALGAPSPAIAEITLVSVRAGAPSPHPIP